MIFAVNFFLVMCAQLISHVLLFVTPRTVNCQALLSIGILPWDSPGKNTGVGCHFLLQEIFLTHGLNLCLLHWQMDSLPLSHLGRLFLKLYKWINYLKTKTLMITLLGFLFLLWWLCSHWRTSSWVLCQSLRRLRRVPLLEVKGLTWSSLPNSRIWQF